MARTAQAPFIAVLANPLTSCRIPFSSFLALLFAVGTDCTGIRSSLSVRAAWTASHFAFSLLFLYRHGPHRLSVVSVRASSFGCSYRIALRIRALIRASYPCLFLSLFACFSFIYSAFRLCAVYFARRLVGTESEDREAVLSVQITRPAFLAAVSGWLTPVLSVRGSVWAPKAPLAASAV